MGGGGAVVGVGVLVGKGPGVGGEVCDVAVSVVGVVPGAGCFHIAVDVAGVSGRGEQVGRHARRRTRGGGVGVVGEGGLVPVERCGCVPVGELRSLSGGPVPGGDQVPKGGGFGVLLVGGGVGVLGAVGGGGEVPGGVVSLLCDGDGGVGVGGGDVGEFPGRGVGERPGRGLFVRTTGVGGDRFGVDVAGDGHGVVGALRDGSVGVVAGVDGGLDQLLIRVVGVPGGGGLWLVGVGVVDLVGAGGEVPGRVVGVFPCGVGGAVRAGGGLGGDLVHTGKRVCGDHPVAAGQFRDSPVRVVGVPDRRDLFPTLVGLYGGGEQPGGVVPVPGDVPGDVGAAVRRPCSS